MTGDRVRRAELPGYTFLQPLGSGGHAQVFLYEQVITRLKVAVKVLNADAVDEAAYRRFTAEANVMAQLADHPYIVPVMQAAVTADGWPYIVMKYYPKPNMLVRARRERFSVPEVLSLGVKIASAVETAHRAGILHRDIKPANILTSQYDEPGLTDFGIAATIADGVTAADGLSVPWSPPEVLFATSPGDQQADVYSLGATLWNLLAGRSPYEEPRGDNSHPAIMRRVRQGPVPAVPRDDVPESLQRLLRQTLMTSPLGRPQTALALAHALQAVEQEQRLPLTPIVLPEAAGSPVYLDHEDDEAAPTRVRGVRVIGEVTDATTTSRSTMPTASQPAATGRERAAGPPEPVPEVTVRRPVQVPAVPDAPAPAPAPAPAFADAEPDGVPVTRHRRRRLLTAGVGGTAALVVVVAAAVAGGGEKNAPAAPSPVETQDAIANGVAPGTPAVVAKRVDPTTVRFTWTYDNARATDTFRWRRTGSGTRPTTGAARTASLDLRTAPNREVCLAVRAVRAEGLASPESAGACG